MAKLYLSLGSNLGSREESLNKAVHAIEHSIGRIVARSVFYASAPWGFHSEKEFLNACICVDTTMDVFSCLHCSQEIERNLGRKQKTTSTYTDREIDIDLLFYDDFIVHNDELQLPHPLLAQREFVLRPLCEIAPDFIHPELKESVRELLARYTKRASSSQTT